MRTGVKIVIKPDNPTKLLIDVSPLWLTKGIFHYLNDTPWQALGISEIILENDYYLQHSGKKPIAPIVHYYLGDDGVISEAGMIILGNLVATKFYEPWRHLFKTYYADYDPLQNYKITEHHEYFENGESEATDETTHGKETRTTDDASHMESSNDSENITKREEGSQVQDNKRFGYNSSNPVPADKYEGTGTSSSNDTNERVGERESADSRENVVKNSGKDLNVGTKNDSTTGERDVTRSGINGIVSIQRLIMDDRKLWNDNFFEQVYRDIDSVLTLPIYPSKRRLQSWVLNFGYPNK